MLPWSSRSTTIASWRMSSRMGVGLQFSLRHLVEETDALTRMAREFIDEGTAHELDLLKNGLKAVGDEPAGTVHELCLGPLRTKPTDSYEAGSRSGGRELYAEMTGIWELRPLGNPTRSKRILQFVGKASTVVELWDNDCEIARWRIELGAHDSPGCYFHIQGLGERDEPRVPVPRMPSPFVTPMSAIEFVLGELFQDQWARETNRARHSQQRWRVMQAKRWLALLEWQGEAVTLGGTSPWMNLKSAKPPDRLFI